MNSREFDRVAGSLRDLAQRIQTEKRPGYTVGADDVLANFYRAAERAGITVGQAWAVHFLKHIDAILAIMTRPDLPVSEAPPGRFADATNYLELGFALLHERAARASGGSGGTPLLARVGNIRPRSTKAIPAKAGRRKSSRKA